MQSIGYSVVFVVMLFLSLSHAFQSRRGMRLFMTSKYLGKDPVFVAGGSRGLGLEVIKKLSSLGTPVHALVRSKEAEETVKALPGVKAFLGDAMDAEAVQQCMQGCVAAVTALGGKLTEESSRLQRVDYVGNSNVVEQAGILGVERVILVTSVGCGSTANAISRQAYLALEDALEAKTRAERDLKLYTNTDWTIIRPGCLLSQLKTGNAILTTDTTASGSITREDCAELIVKVLGSPEGRTTRLELSAIDPSLSVAKSNIEEYSLQ